MQSERIKELEDKLATERNGYGQLWNDYQKLKKQNAELERRVGEVESKNKELKKRIATKTKYLKLEKEMAEDSRKNYLNHLKRYKEKINILSEGGVNENEK